MLPFGIQSSSSSSSSVPTIGSPSLLVAMAASPDEGSQEEWDRQFELFFNGNN
jgi:hypothetical protein